MELISALIDTNIMIDLILKRHPFFENAFSLWEKIDRKEIKGFITSNSVTDIIYLSRREYSVKEIKPIILNLLKLIKIIDVDENDIIEAFNLDFKDYEDALQVQCSKKTKVDFIVTRNEKDFKDSEIPAIQTEKFLELLNKQD
jgi:predicted nucleic acid-binding protein